MGYFEKSIARSRTHVWATGLAAATAANAAMANAVFIASEFTIEVAGGREIEGQESVLYEVDT